jgi:predicted TIM-barrel fold metal-dependent hydrolase
VKFLSSWGKTKVCFATDYPLLQWERVMPELAALDLSDDVRRRFLRDNAIAAFKLRV